MINIKKTTGIVQVNEQNVAIIDYSRKAKQVTVTLNDGKFYDINHVKDFLPEESPFEELEKEKSKLRRSNIYNCYFRRIAEAYYNAIKEIEDFIKSKEPYIKNYGQDRFFDMIQETIKKAIEIEKQESEIMSENIAAENRKL